MNLDDESLLSAYLDDELDPLDRLAVESSMASDPSLSENLAKLRALRNLVSGLSRPRSPGIADEVLGRISGVCARPRPWQRARRPLARAAIGLAAFAAGILVLLLLPYWLVRRPHQPLSRRGERSTIAAANPVETPAPGPGPSLAVNLAVDSPSADQPHPVPGPALGGAFRADSRDSGGPDLLRARALLDDPSLRHVFLVTDVIEEPAREQLSAVLGQTTRLDYFRFTVSQGIVIDPEHPGEATVFAIVLEDRHLDWFRDRLKKEFGDHVEEREVEPEVVSQLSEIGQVVALPPTPMGDVIIPRSAQLAQLEAHDRPTLEQERSTPDSRRRLSGKPLQDLRTASGKAGPARITGGPATPAPVAGNGVMDRPPIDAPTVPGVVPQSSGTGQPVVVLVWMTRNRAG